MQLNPCWISFLLLVLLVVSVLSSNTFKIVTSLGIFSITLLGILWMKNVVILNYNGFKLLGWIYNLHHLTGQGYYLKSRYLESRLIQYLPNSNKGLKKDFLILPGEWHDGLPCPTREGKLGRALGLDSQFQIYPLFLYFNFCLYLKFPLTHILPTMSFCLSWWFCRPTCYCAQLWPCKLGEFGQDFKGWGLYPLWWPT